MWCRRKNRRIGVPAWSRKQTQATRNDAEQQDGADGQPVRIAKKSMKLQPLSCSGRSASRTLGAAIRALHISHAVANF
jgi:hypothetical protein